MDLEQAPTIGAAGPRPDRSDAGYWDGLAEGKLMIQHCPCGQWIWPADVICPDCHRFDPPWEEVVAEGTVFTWTRTWQKFTPEFAELTPYVDVVVTLDGAGGTRLLGLLLGDDSTPPQIGERVTGVIQPGSELTGGAAVLRWTRSPA